MKVKKYNPDLPMLVNSVVCTVDILGFSSMIRDSWEEGCGDALLKEVSHLINKNKQCIIPNKYSEGKIKIYTDNMVVGFPIEGSGKEELDEILENVSEYQFNLALEGLFVRGGISMGAFYMNDDIVFGPALLDAHYTESELACYPRIILDDKTVACVKKYITHYEDGAQRDKILIDTDGRWFLNYLSTVFNYYKECTNAYEFEQTQIELLYKHKAKIEEMLVLNTSNIRVWDKYVWTANYHNYFCDLHFPKEKELKIAKKMLLGWPREIDSKCY